MPLRPTLVLIASSALLAAACASGSGDDSLLAEDGARADEGGGNTGGATGSDTIPWEDCGGGDQCAVFEVPLDYDDPSGETVDLSITKVPASGDRIGSLFVNPGGPGGTASDFASSLGFMLPEEITDRFDIVGVDPRGTGVDAIDCGADFTDLYGVDPTIEDDEDTDTLLDTSQDYVDDCEAAVGDILPHLGTRDVARDMDAVREAMGDDQLSYLGFSYGTSIGQVYADMFPENVRAMVLDGVLEIGPTGVESAAQQAVGFERALNAFADWCDDDSSCAIGPDALDTIDELVETVETEPVPASPRDLGPGELSLGLALPLYDQGYWPDLADSVVDALDGDGSGMVSLADQYLGIGGFDVYFAVNCLDFEWPEDPEDLLDAAKDANDEAPHFGEAIVTDYVRCPLWPVEPDPLTPVSAPGTPPILVISTTNDPATPYESGVNVAERLESGVLLTYEGDGHTVAANGVPCVDDALTTYLVDLEPPEDGSVC